MGRRKIQIQPLADDRNRSVTFLKRKAGLFKKAYELGVLCSADVAVIVFNQAGKLYEFSSGNIDDTLIRYSNYTGSHHERKGPEDYAPKGTIVSNGAGSSNGGRNAQRRTSDEDDDEEDDDDDDGDYGAGPSTRRSRGGISNARGGVNKYTRQTPSSEHNDTLAHAHQHQQQQAQSQLPMLPPVQGYANGTSLPPDFAAQFAQVQAQNGLVNMQAGFNPYLAPWPFAPSVRMNQGQPPMGWNPNLSLPNIPREHQQHQQAFDPQAQQLQSLYYGNSGQANAHAPLHMLNLLASHPAFAPTATDEQRNRAQQSSPQPHSQGHQHGLPDDGRPPPQRQMSLPQPGPQRHGETGTANGESSPRTVPSRSNSLNNRPSLSVAIPGPPQRIDSGPIVEEPKQMNPSHETAAARNARFAADILPSPSAFLNDSAYSGYGPLSALATTATGASALFQWPKSAGHDGGAGENGAVSGTKRDHDQSSVQSEGRSADDGEGDGDGDGDGGSNQDDERDNKRQRV